LVALFALGGCLGVEGRVPVGFDPPPVAVAAAPLPVIERTPGAIFTQAGFAGIAEDNRARAVGDILTVRLVERTRASKSASANAKRETDLNIGLPDGSPIGKPVFLGSADYGFDGGGGAEQSNRLFGDITVSVVEVRANGVLVVRGQKVVRVNRGDEYVNLTGLVRPEDIGPDNSVPSTRVADARIAYSGVGEVASQSRQGWLMRLLNYFTPY